MTLAHRIFAVAAVMCVAIPAHANLTKPAPSSPLAVGDAAPNFEFKPSEAKTPMRLSDFQGKAVLLVFYPRAFSHGCTRQLSEYRDEIDVFNAHDTQILAISSDTQEKNDRFQEAEDFPFPLIGDPNHEIIRKYGVPTRTWLGREFAQRTIVLIDKHGVVQFIELDYNVRHSKIPLYEQIRTLYKTAEEAALTPESKS